MCPADLHTIMLAVIAMSAQSAYQNGKALSSMTMSHSLRQRSNNPIHQKPRLGTYCVGEYPSADATLLAPLYTQCSRGWTVTAKAEAANLVLEDDGLSLPGEIARRETLRAKLDAAVKRWSRPLKNAASTR
tara:strand:- start:136 stop:528 length:393 start_codon:yes stop_codon:yes gene_type:complete